MLPSTRLPVTVITGFLGSGKTTLLSRILLDPGMENAAVIINEFGEIGLDHVLVTKPKEDMILLSSGCLCCTVRGDLLNTLTTMLEERARGDIPPFDRVLVETTGLADPVPVLLSVTADEDLSAWFRIDGIITLVDAVHGGGQLDAHAEAVKQVSVADRIVISKTDIAAPDLLPKLRSRLQRLNPGACVIEAANGAVDPALFFDVHPDANPGGREKVADWLRFEDHDLPLGQGHRHARPEGDSGHRTHAHHDGSIRSFSIYFDGPITPDGLQVWMDMLGALRGPDLLRVKALLNVGGLPIVVQAVQHLFHPPVALPEWPDEERRSRLVFITRGIGREEIERTLSAFELIPGRSIGGLPLDPQGYERFVNAIRGMRADVA